MKIFAPVRWLFAIRERAGIGTRIWLTAAFFLVVALVWIGLTDNPRWLNRLLVAARPGWQLAAGDEVTLSLDRQQAQLLVSCTTTGRVIVRDLPPIAAEHLPELGPDGYSGFFARLEADGLGELERRDDGSYRARVADADLARARLAELGPRPFELALQEGEQVDIAIDFLSEQAKFSVERVGGGAKAAIELPPEGEREPVALVSYPDLSRVISEMGLERLALHPDRETSKSSFVAFVADSRVAQEHALGPRNPMPPLALGDEVTITLTKGDSTVIELATESTGKKKTIAVTTSLLAATVIPEPDGGAYPGLPALLADIGVGSRDGGGYEVSDIAAARAAGLGLGKPVEMRILPRSTLPSPTEVVDSLPVLWGERDLPQATWMTIKRILKGFGWAMLVCVPLGLFMGAFIRIGMFVDPAKLAGTYLPLPAIVPLTMAWMGIGEERITLFLAISNGVVLLPFVVAAVQGVPQVYLDTARTLGATRGQLFRYCLLSVSWPALFDALRISFAVGWTWIMLAETIGVTSGLGYIINTSQRRGYIEHVYVVIVLVITMAFLSNLLWSLAARCLFPYVDKKK